MAQKENKELSKQIRKSLFLLFKEEDKSIVFRYYVKGEVRGNPDGTELTYPDNSPVDLKNDKFYESKEYKISDWMGCFIMIIKGSKGHKQLVDRTVAEVVSDIKLQIEKENDKQ